MVREALESVVSNGTGRNAYIEGYKVGGKTGTAQKVNNGRYMVGNYITSFIGFLPADNPEVIVYIAIDNAKGVTQYGGTVAAPIAKNVLQSCTDILNIKSISGYDKKYNWNDIKYYKVPNVIGLSVKEANKELKNFKVEYNGNGEKVIYQSPTEGSKVMQNGTIRLYLGD